MEQWKEYKMEDLIDEIAMGPFGSNIKVDCFTDSGIPVLNGSNLQGFKLNETSFNYVTPQKADSLGRANAGRGDIVITHRGTLGQIVYIPNDSKYDRYVISQSQFRVKLKKQYVNPIFIVYYFHSRQGLYILLSNASQVGVPAIARPSTSFKSLKVQLPSLEIQERISAILSSLDAKIELNRRINDNLEQQAQALFRSWFVDFEPFGGVMPKEWKIKSLSEIATYLNGLAMQKYPATSNNDTLPVLKIRELGQGFVDDNSNVCSRSSIGNQYFVNDGDVIFSWSGTLMVKVWIGGECGLNQHLFKVSSERYPKWFFYMWTKYHNDSFIRIAKDKAVTMGHIKRGELDKAKVLIPTKELIDKASALFNPILEQYIHTHQESSRLATLRDALLPRLMSGELKVNEINA